MSKFSLNNPTTRGAIDRVNQADAGKTGTQDKINQLKALRTQLDSGQISVKDFLAQGQPLANQVNSELFTLGGQGSGAATTATQMLADFQQGSGFKQSGEGNKDIVSNLGPKYEQQVRDSMLPDNLDPESRKKTISDIPTDIALTSDRGQIEREGVREATQAQQGLDQRDTLNKSRLSDLADILASRATQQFQRSIPQVAEDANSAGVFRSSGYGNALAQKQNEFTQDLTSQIGMQGIQDRNAYTGGLEDIQNNRIGNQQAGLQRQFSLDDFARDKDYAIAMANANQPKQQGKSSSERNQAYATTGISAIGAASGGKGGGGAKKP